MKVRYGTLFSVELFHEYFREGWTPSLRLVPSQATQLDLRRLGLRSIQKENRFTLVARLANDGSLQVPPSPETRWTFHLLLEQPSLLSVTNIDINRLAKERLYFSNLGQPASSSHLSLSSELAVFSLAANYRAGDLVQEGGAAFLRLTDGGAQATSTTSVWLPKPSPAYANSADFIPVFTRTAEFEVSAAARFEVELFSLNRLTDALDESRQKLVIQSPDGVALDFLRVPLPELEDGRYRALINGEEFVFYLLQERRELNHLGIVEIFHHLPDGHDFQPVDNSTHTAKSLNYALRFSSRAAFLQYEMKSDRISELVHFASGSDPAPFTRATDGLSFSSEHPLELHEDQEVEALAFKLGDQEIRAPKPDPHRAETFTFAGQAPDQRWVDPTFRIQVNL